MKKTKFRAWDKNIKKMSSVFDIQDYADANDSDLGDGKLPNIDRDNLELMQFTGLLDKKGKEIYEGDIVEIFEIISSGIMGDNLSSLGYREVIFSNGLYGFNNGFGQALRLITNKTKVIGNIYENASLLNNK